MTKAQKKNISKYIVAEPLQNDKNQKKLPDRTGKLKGYLLQTAKLGEELVVLLK